MGKTTARPINEVGMSATRPKYSQTNVDPSARTDTISVWWSITDKKSFIVFIAHLHH